MAVDDKSRDLVEEVLGVEFEEDIAKREGIIIRKEIWALIKKYLSKE